MISLQYLNPISKSFSIISLNFPITITITYINKDKKCIIYTDTVQYYQEYNGKPVYYGPTNLHSSNRLFFSTQYNLWMLGDKLGKPILIIVTQDYLS